MNDRPPSLVLHSATAGETDDGRNDTEWTTRVSAREIHWTRGATTADAVDAPAFQVMDAFSTVLGASTTWAVVAGVLQLTDPAGDELSFARTPPPPPVTSTGMAFWLVTNAVNGAVPAGASLDPTAGHVIVSDAQGRQVASVDVTKEDLGLVPLPAGTYTVTATTSQGACSPVSHAVPAEQVAEVTVACPR